MAIGCNHSVAVAPQATRALPTVKRLQGRRLVEIARDRHSAPVISTEVEKFPTLFMNAGCP